MRPSRLIWSSAAQGVNPRRFRSLSRGLSLDLCRPVAKLCLKPPSNGSVGQNGESSLLGGRFAAALRQLLKPKTCLIRTEIGFRRCLVKVKKRSVLSFRRMP